jgi:hypothetical protein
VPAGLVLALDRQEKGEDSDMSAVQEVTQQVSFNALQYCVYSIATHEVNFAFAAVLCKGVAVKPC